MVLKLHESNKLEDVLLPTYIQIIEEKNYTKLTNYIEHSVHGTRFLKCRAFTTGK
uniref:Uncharacterized protein n=1 Tax=Nelumbo nucifera TaxID=4432 RepID=A0A822YCD0_NELNU|nr:TPA_asm: hypothetical protein HUJ06_030194 [Nelumbo nucifera]